MTSLSEHEPLFSGEYTDDLIIIGTTLSLIILTGLVIFGITITVLHL